MHCVYWDKKRVDSNRTATQSTDTKDTKTILCMQQQQKWEAGNRMKRYITRKREKEKESEREKKKRE